MQIPPSQEVTTDAAFIVTSDDTLPVSGIIWRAARFILLHFGIKDGTQRIVQPSQRRSVARPAAPFPSKQRVRRTLESSPRQLEEMEKNGESSTRASIHIQLKAEGEN